MKIIVYHAVTERPLKLNQIITFDDNNHSGMYERVMAKKDIVNKIYNNLEKYPMESLDHHTKVALRELALEKVRQEKFKDYPSRLSSLYVSKNIKNAYKWAEYFISLGRPTFQIVKLEVNGNIFTGDAQNCFDGLTNEKENLKLAEDYWLNKPNKKNKPPLYETIVNGKIKVIKIIKEYNK